MVVECYTDTALSQQIMVSNMYWWYSSVEPNLGKPSNFCLYIWRHCLNLGGRSSSRTYLFWKNILIERRWGPAKFEMSHLCHLVNPKNIYVTKSAISLCGNLPLRRLYSYFLILQFVEEWVFAKIIIYTRTVGNY